MKTIVSLKLFTFLGMKKRRQFRIRHLLAVSDAEYTNGLLSPEFAKGKDDGALRP